MSRYFCDVSPAVIAGQDAEALKDEVVRRMEVFVLETLHRLLLPPPERRRSDKEIPPTPSTDGEDALRAIAGFTGRVLRKGGRAEAPQTGISLPRKASAGTIGVMATPMEGDDCECCEAHSNASAASVTPMSHERKSIAARPTAATAPTTVAVSQRGSSLGYTSNLRVLHTSRNQLLVLALLYRNVLAGVVSTQRDVYYHLVRHVPTQDVVNRAVRQLSNTLRLPRQLMGVTAGTRGYVAGWIYYNGVSLRGTNGMEEGMPLPLMDADLNVAVLGSTESEPTSPECLAGAQPSTPRQELCLRKRTRLSLSPPSLTSAGDVVGFQVPSHVCAILVVEKHAVFAQLLREGLPQLLPCVLLTAQGFPTHAARLLLANMHAALPRAAVVGLVDYNPHGLAILASYRWGAADIGASEPHSVPLEKGYCALPGLRWLGLRSTHVERLEEYSRRVTALSGELGPVAGCSRGDWELSRVLPASHARGATSCIRSTPQNPRHTSRGGDGADAPAAPSTPSASSATSPLFHLPSPVQFFTHRDAVVLTHLIEQLENRLQRTQMPGPAVAAAKKCQGDEGTREAAHFMAASGLGVTRTNVSLQGRCLGFSFAAPSPFPADANSVAAWLTEARDMRLRRAKYELEILYAPPFADVLVRSPVHQWWQQQPCSGGTPPPSALASWVCQQILRRQYV